MHESNRWCIKIKEELNLEGMISKYERNEKMESYIITSAQLDARPNYELLKNMEEYARIRGVKKILVMPTQGYKSEERLDDYFYENDMYEVITKDYNFNKHLKSSNHKIKPQQINPLTGLQRFTQRDKSTILASPKQVMKPIPNNNKIPKVLLTTGAVTQPNYRDNNIGNKAKKDHEYGFIYVESIGNKYQYRQVEALKTGRFADLEIEMDKGTAYQSSIDALVIADWHHKETNKKVKAETMRMLDMYKPKYAVFHDLLTASSINHHEDLDTVTRASKAMQGNLTLDSELKSLYKEINEICLSHPDTEFVVTKSNHDEFLDRYIRSGKFINDPQNAYLASKLFTGMIEKKDPLVYALSMYGELPENIRFLKRDETFKVRGYSLGDHGDKGANGARGSIRSTENAYGKSITAHKHSPEKVRKTLVVGTSTDLKQDYTVGLSSWMNTHGLVYSTGTAQLVNIINGSHRLDNYSL